MKSFLEFSESIVPAHMQGKQKPYVSSDGKGNYEVLGNTGKTKATFTRAEHGKDAHVKAQKHLRSKYDEYMKEEVELDEGFVDDIKQSFAKGMTDKIKKAIPTQYHKHYDFDSVKSVNDSKEIIKKAKSAGHIKEEIELTEEELDELSKTTLGNYVKDASADRSSKNFELGYEAGAGRQPTQRAHDQEGNRRKGIRRAINKLTKEEQEVEEATIAGTPGWEKIKKDVKDKSGAVHSPMSRARDLARQALKNVRAKKQNKGE